MTTLRNLTYTFGRQLFINPRVTLFIFLVVPMITGLFHMISKITG
jgi:hypothetical protein